MDGSKNIKKQLKLFPWYSGLSNGLLFFPPVSMVFLIMARGLTLHQVALLSVVSKLIAILFQKYLLKVIKKTGNEKSVRLGNFIIMFAVIFITLGNYLAIMMGYIY